MSGAVSVRSLSPPHFISSHLISTLLKRLEGSADQVERAIGAEEPLSGGREGRGGEARTVVFDQRRVHG